MEKTATRIMMFFAAIVAALSSCQENIDTSARYVFKEYTVASYLETHEQFSEYVRLMKEQKASDITETSVYQLLSAYGNYTCFAPTNEGIQKYLESLVEKKIIAEPSWDAFTSEKVRDSIRYVIVMNSILDGKSAQKTYYVGDFPNDNEEFATSTMADCKISVTYDKNNRDICYIDSVCMVSTTNREIECINGIIHELNYPINPTNATLGNTLHLYASQPDCGFFVMANLVEACGLTDTLSVVKDYEWDRLVKTGAITKSFWNNLSVYVNPPEHRKYGFTLFAETDEFWKNTLNKEIADITVDDVRKWVAEQGFYPNAVDNTDYHNEDNVLNQFVTYHLLPMRIPVDKLVLHYNEKGYNYKSARSLTVPAWNHYVTMGKRRLLRLWESKQSQGVYLNRFPELNDGRHEDYNEKSCLPENEGIYVNTTGDSKLVKLLNSIIYPIEKPLVYNQHVREELKKCRLRYDVYEFMPETMSNDMRIMDHFERFYFPADEIYPYFQDFSVNTKDMTFYLLNGIAQNWPNYQADEVLCEGLYDVTLRLPPVPLSGIYELRMGVSTESPWRGICQVYFGDNRDKLAPAGIPVDMGKGGNDATLGWEKDTEDDDYNTEIDKRMRNNGFMKGPAYFTEIPGSSETAREIMKTTRRILIRTHMDADKVYYLRFKTVQDMVNKQLFLDYLEWCPKEKFDNPEKPEDIW